MGLWIRMAHSPDAIFGCVVREILGGHGVSSPSSRPHDANCTEWFVSERWCCRVRVSGPAERARIQAVLCVLGGTFRSAPLGTTRQDSYLLVVHHVGRLV